jgi:hypothetical protein
MNTIFLTTPTSKINELNHEIALLEQDGYAVVSFKITPAAEFDQYGNYTVVVVQLTKN